MQQLTLHLQPLLFSELTVRDVSRVDDDPLQRRIIQLVLCDCLEPYNRSVLAKQAKGGARDGFWRSRDFRPPRLHKSQVFWMDQLSKLSREFFGAIPGHSLRCRALIAWAPVATDNHQDVREMLHQEPELQLGLLEPLGKISLMRHASYDWGNLSEESAVLDEVVRSAALHHFHGDGLASNAGRDDERGKFPQQTAPSFQELCAQHVWQGI